VAQLARSEQAGLGGTARHCPPSFPWMGTRTNQRPGPSSVAPHGQGSLADLLYNTVVAQEWKKTKRTHTRLDACSCYCAFCASLPLPPFGLLLQNPELEKRYGSEFSECGKVRQVYHVMCALDTLGCGNGGGSGQLAVQQVASLNDLGRDVVSWDGWWR
jgi:hypothetical protein